jgi:hypothetical protein
VPSPIAAPAARLGLPALLCLTSLVAAPTAAAAQTGDEHLTPPPARWALAAGVFEAGLGIALAGRLGELPASVTLAGGPVGASASLQVHLPSLARDDEPEGTIAYISGGAIQFLRADNVRKVPSAWALLGGTRRWPSGPQGVFFDTGLGVWWMTEGSLAGNTGGIALRFLVGWAF